LKNLSPIFISCVKVIHGGVRCFRCDIP
jgi:hypothetical protein